MIKRPWVISICFFISACLSQPVAEDEMLVGQIRQETAKELFEKEGLKASAFGSSMIDKIKEIILGFDYYEKCSIEKGRYLVITASQLLLKKINENEKIRPYLIEYPFPEKRVFIPIFCFYEDEIPEKPFLSVVSCSNGKIFYKTGENQEIIYEETYEEALKIVQEQNRKNLRDKSKE